jgi:general secretion pathway protein C
LVAAAAFFWGLKLFVKAPAAPPQALVVETGNGARGDLTRLLGAEPVVVAEAAPPAAANDARFQLLGVLSPRMPAAAKEGLALIAVDGKAAKAYRVGAVVDGDTVLQAVRARGASLGPRGGAANVSLDIAPPAAPAVGTLPPAMDGQASLPRLPNIAPVIPPMAAAPPPANRARPLALPQMQSRPPPQGSQLPISDGAQTQ